MILSTTELPTPHLLPQTALRKRPLQLLVKKVKWSPYRPGVAQRVGRSTALLFHDRDTRMGWVVSSMPRPHFTPGKDPVPIVQEAGWDPGPVWTGGKSRPHRNSIPDRPARSRSLYRLSYRAHPLQIYRTYNLSTLSSHMAHVWTGCPITPLDITILVCMPAYFKIQELKISSASCWEAQTFKQWTCSAWPRRITISSGLVVTLRTTGFNRDSSVRLHNVLLSFL